MQGHTCSRGKSFDHRRHIAHTLSRRPVGARRSGLGRSDVFWTELSSSHASNPGWRQRASFANGTTAVFVTIECATTARHSARAISSWDEKGLHVTSRCQSRRPRRCRPAMPASASVHLRRTRTVVNLIPSNPECTCFSRSRAPARQQPGRHQRDSAGDDIRAHGDVRGANARADDEPSRRRHLCKNKGATSRRQHYKTTAGTYNVSTRFCQPDKASDSKAVVQVLTHGMRVLGS